MKRLATLMGYLLSQRQEIDNLINTIRSKVPQTEEETVFVGYLMHNLYCALEDIFKRVANTFENNVDDLSRYHRDLLQRMSFAVPGVRPSLLSNDSFKVLDELRRFRHLFRHAYSYHLDPGRVGQLRSDILKAWASIEYDLDTFYEFLESVRGQS